MSKKTKTIPVLDIDNRFLSNTTPAKARMMLKADKASVFQNDPFILRMNGEVGDNTMSRTKKQRTHSDFIQNFTRYFSEEKEVYVQNLSATNISLTLSGQGEVTYISIASTRRPMNLTQYADIQLIKQSSDFRRLVNRNPSILRLMTEEEYEDYYEKLANENGTTIQQEMRLGHEVHDILMGKRRPNTSELQQEMDKKLEDKEEMLLNPKEPDSRVVGLCAMADKDMDEGQRVSSRDFIERLESLAPELDDDDWEFISTKGVYPTVKAFARKQLDGPDGEDEE